MAPIHYIHSVQQAQSVLSVHSDQRKCGCEAVNATAMQKTLHSLKPESHAKTIRGCAHWSEVLQT